MANINEMKNKYYEKLKNLPKNSYAMNRTECESTMARLIQLEKDRSIKKEMRDYRLIKRFDVLEVTIEGQKIQKLVKKETELRFVCEEVSDKFGTYLAPP